MSISSYLTNRRYSQEQRAVTVCRLLSNEARFQILTALIESQKAGQELCVSELASAVAISQSATSHQLALLEAHNVVMKKRMGQTVCYGLAASPVARDVRRVIRTFGRTL